MYVELIRLWGVVNMRNSGCVKWNLLSGGASKDGR